MTPASPNQPHHPTAMELAHAPETAVLIALDTLLAMTTVTIHLSLPELDLLQRDSKRLDPDGELRDLAVAHDILDLAAALRSTIQLYRNLVLRP